MRSWTSQRCERTVGHLMTVIALTTLALVSTAPRVSEAKTTLWLFPESENPRAGHHVVTDGEFTLIVQNRATGEHDGATLVSLVVAVNDSSLLGGVTLTWPDGTVTTVDADGLQYGTPTIPCDGKRVPGHGIYPTDFTTDPAHNGDGGQEIEPGEQIEIGVEVTGDDGLEVHFDAIAQGTKIKRGAEVCYGVVNPSGHCVTVVFAADTGECPHVDVEKTASAGTAEVGGEIEYTIEVSNSADCDPVADLVVTEDIPTVIDPDSGDPVPAFTVNPATVVPTPISQTEDLITWDLAGLGPGESTLFTLIALFEEASDGQEIVNTACATADELDDPVCGSAVVAIGNVSSEADLGGPGFWCNRVRFALAGGDRITYTVEELDAFLTDIDVASATFSEIYDGSTLELTEDLLCRPQDAASAADRLARHLLTLWFNIVSGRVDPELTLGDLCPGDEMLPEDADATMTIGRVVLEAENEILVAEPDDAILDWWKDLIDYINNASSGPCDEEAVPQPRRARGLRLGHRGGGGPVGH